MNVDIKSEHIELGGSNILLVSVKGGKAMIGTCSVGHNFKKGDTSSLNRVFYVGTEPVVSIVCPNNGDKRTDRMISVCPGYGGMAEDIHSALTETLNKINRGDSLENGLRDLFVFLQDGVYTVYTAEYYPTDGGTSFFWGAYNIPHEVHGSAVYNRTIGKDKTYRPCFLVPGNTLDIYTAKKRVIIDEAVKSRKYQGIVYHLSGLHSVLLKGHHGAVSCIAAGIPFTCAVVERISDTYTLPFEVPVVEPENKENAENSAPVEQVKPHEGVAGFRSASVKIPLDIMPKDMMRNILENRAEYKPTHFANIRHKMNSVRHRALSNNTLPHDVHEKSELMPDCEMIESAFAVGSLSDEQLNALLSGETDLNGEVIISPNYYSSIVTACNYLQFHDEKKFIDFGIAIMENPELYATHEYVAKRVSRVSSKKAYRFFKEVLNDQEGVYEKLYSTAERYIKEYDAKHDK